MPRRVIFHKESPGDPQTVLQDDKDPMLTLDPDYLDCRTDPEAAGDLGKNINYSLSGACLLIRLTLTFLYSFFPLET